MTSSEKPNRAYVLSIIAGLLIICNTALLGAVVAWFPQIMPTIPGSNIDTAGLYRLTALGLTFGVLVLLGAAMLHVRPALNKIWSLMIILFSIASVLTGGGFIIGFILGIIGGASALSRKLGTQATEAVTT